jgi:hypothetical protein
MSYMTLQAELPESKYYAEFTGSQCEVWHCTEYAHFGLMPDDTPIYSGPIEDMPPNALNEAIKLGYIKQVSP